MTMLRINLLGEPRISASDDSAIRLPTKKVQALLIYLASPPGVARARDQLAGLLWSRNPEAQARTNLRQNLARLRKSLGDAKGVITADAHRIALTADLAETDIVEFERLLSRGDVASLETATELLRGEFAAGLHINEPPFEDWIANERRRVSELAIAALGRLLTHYEDRNDPDKTAFLAAKLLAIDPLQERVHQSFMRARRPGSV
jgi:DNA-binding SARP family transcriptional activator